MYDQEVGHISMAKTLKGGRVVAEWKFDSVFQKSMALSRFPRGAAPAPAPEEKVGPSYEVKVSINTDGAKKMYFEAHGICLAKSIQDTDIERLRLAVEKELRFQYAMATGVQWEDWLEVAVTGNVSTHEYSGTRNSNLVIKYNKLKRGVDPATGKVYTVNTNGVAVAFPEPVVATGEKAKEIWEDDKTTEVSYIAATPENLAALEDLIARLGQLRTSLSQFLRQDKVQSSLDNISKNLPALPFPM